MNNDELKTLREQLVTALGGGESHITFDKVVKDFPPAARGQKPQGAPHSAWELVEHMRIAQRDILEFSRNPKHQSPKFPDGYWPETEAPPSADAWQKSVSAFEQDFQELAQIMRNSDLFTPFPHGDGQTLLREAIVVANHNSYHLGELAFLKRMLVDKA